jgi:hypothetical protein
MSWWAGNSTARGSGGAVKHLLQSDDAAPRRRYPPPKFREAGRVAVACEERAASATRNPAWWNTDRARNELTSGGALEVNFPLPAIAWFARLCHAANELARANLSGGILRALTFGRRLAADVATWELRLMLAAMQARRCREVGAGCGGQAVSVGCTLEISLAADADRLTTAPISGDVAVARASAESGETSVASEAEFQRGVDAVGNGAVVFGRAVLFGLKIPVPCLLRVELEFGAAALAGVAEFLQLAFPLAVG